MTETTAATTQIKVEKKLIQNANFQKDKARMRVAIFLDAIAQSLKDLGKDSIGQALDATIQTLSQVRNNGNGKSNKGIILVDQFFAVP